MSPSASICDCENIFAVLKIFSQCLFCFLGKQWQVHINFLHRDSLLFAVMKFFMSSSLCLFSKFRAGFRYLSLFVCIVIWWRFLRPWINNEQWVTSVCVCGVWQYGLWSFQTGYTKFERFLHKNQHTQRKLLNFESWTNGEPQ